MMIRIYKRKTCNDDIKERKIKHAIRDIISKKYKISEAARIHNLSRTTLHYRLKRLCAKKNKVFTEYDSDVSSNEEEKNFGYSSKYSSDQVFTKIQEKALAGYVKTYSHLQQGYSHIQKFVFEYGVVNKIEMPTTWIKNKETEVEWVQGFMKRNAEYLAVLPEHSPCGNTDETEINLLPKRARQSIALEERVQIINEYENNPHIPSITELFDCSWFQALIIIHDKEEIMTSYAKRNKTYDEGRRQKIEFMEKVLYEYILRATYQNLLLCEIFIKKKMWQIKNSIGVNFWYPTQFWMLQFMKKYKITDWELKNLKELLVPGEEKESCLAIQKIVNHVRCVGIRDNVLKQKNEISYNTHIATDNLTDDAKLQDLDDTTSSTELKSPTIEEDDMLQNLENTESSTESKTPNREEEIDFLGRCMYEFVRRRQYIFNGNFNMKIWIAKARSFNKILKIDSFDPNNEWILRFKKTYQISKDQKKLDLNGEQAIGSLVPKHIINYCRQNKDKSKIETLIEPDRATSETYLIEHAPLDVVDVKEEEMECDSEVELIYVEEEEIESLSEVDYIVHKTNTETSAPCGTYDDEDRNSDTHEQEMEWFLDYDDGEEELQSDNACNTYSSNHENIDIKPDISELQQALQNDNNIQCSERLSQDTTTDTRSETNADLNIEITSNAHAIQLLKPLEDFALLDENYRAIGLITQLRDIFQNRQKS